MSRIIEHGNKKYEISILSDDNDEIICKNKWNIVPKTNVEKDKIAKWSSRDIYTRHNIQHVTYLLVKDINENDNIIGLFEISIETKIDLETFVNNNKSCWFQFSSFFQILFSSNTDIGHIHQIYFDGDIYLLSKIVKFILSVFKKHVCQVVVIVNSSIVSSFENIGFTCNKLANDFLNLSDEIEMKYLF
jgi:hypothetical protein